MLRNDLYCILGNRIKELRKRRKMSQDQLANEVGLQRTSITNIEAGKQAAPLHIYYEICSALQESVHDFLPSNFDRIIK